MCLKMSDIILLKSDVYVNCYGRCFVIFEEFVGVVKMLWKVKLFKILYKNEN